NDAGVSGLELRDGNFGALYRRSAFIADGSGDGSARRLTRQGRGKQDRDRYDYHKTDARLCLETHVDSSSEQNSTLALRSVQRHCSKYVFETPGQLGNVRTRIQGRQEDRRF